MRSSGPPIDPSLAMVYRQAREAAGSPVSEMDSWTLELLVGVDSGLEVLDGPRPSSDPQRIAETVGDGTVRRHSAVCHTVGGDLVRVLPAWLLDNGRALCVVSGAFATNIHIADALTTKLFPAKRLRSYALRRRREHRQGRPPGRWIRNRRASRFRQQGARHRLPGRRGPGCGRPERLLPPRPALPHAHISRRRLSGVPACLAGRAFAPLSPAPAKEREEESGLPDFALAAHARPVAPDPIRGGRRRRSRNPAFFPEYSISW